jgi:hypothetical protein
MRPDRLYRAFEFTPVLSADAVALNPQPLPPRLAWVLLNPQPLPPRVLAVQLLGR